MGCNTSKEAMQAVETRAELAKEKLQNLTAQGESLLNSLTGKERTESPKKEGKDEKDKENDKDKEKNNENHMQKDMEKETGKVMENKESKDEKEKDGGTEEPVDIDLKDPEVNEAAVKIQAAFRGHQTRKNMKQEDAEPKQNLEEEFSPDDKELCEAATKIQASFRGHLARKTAPRKEETEELSKELEKLGASGGGGGEEEVDLDLSDPDLQVAATKIQASFRGHRVRKEKQGKPEE